MRAAGACFLIAFGVLACGGSATLAEGSEKAARKPVHATTHAKKPAERTAKADHRTKRRVGHASVYHDKFQGHKTATGEVFSQNKLTAASRDLPLGSKATVTNRENGKSVDVEVNDRGPYVDGRVVDLSKTAAKQIGLDKKEGVAPVIVEAKPPQ
jgi:rare lipoprotein A (peptidoglycan hydrolase)